MFLARKYHGQEPRIYPIKGAGETHSRTWAFPTRKAQTRICQQGLASIASSPEMARFMVNQGQLSK